MNAIKMIIKKNLYWLGFTTLVVMLSFCTPKRTVKLVGVQNGYLEKEGKYCNLFYKNKDTKYVLLADSVTRVIVYDSVFAYSRVKLSTYPDMTIVKVDQGETLIKSNTDGLNFAKVFPTFFSFSPSTTIHDARELYDFMSNKEMSIDEQDVISL